MKRNTKQYEEWIETEKRFSSNTIAQERRKRNRTGVSEKGLVLTSYVSLCIVAQSQSGPNSYVKQ